MKLSTIQILFIGSDYMSAYSFIASDYKLPELDNSKEKVITVREAIKLGIKPHEMVPWERMNPNTKVMIIDNESDLGELVITKDTGYEKNVRWYTNKLFIYSVDFRYTESRANQLVEYLKENIKEGQKLELWSIWLDDKQKIKPIVCNYNEITLYDIKQMYDWNSDSYINHSCIIIKR